MSVDENLDRLMNKVSAFFLSFIPYSVLLSLMNLYLGISVFAKRILAQTQTSFRALANSFYPTRLFFYKYGSTYVPVVHRGAEIPAIYGDYEWIYQTDQRSFISTSAETTERARRFPYLGGTVIHTTDSGASYTDITDWLAEQRIYSFSDEVPLQVLVAAWAHSNDYSVWHTYVGYKVMFMTLEGDEITFDVSNGEKIGGEDGGAWPGSSAVVEEDEEEKEEQEQEEQEQEEQEQEEQEQEEQEQDESAQDVSDATLNTVAEAETSDQQPI